MSTHKDLLDRLADARPPRLDPDRPGPDPAGIMLRAQAGPKARKVRRRLIIGLVPAAAAVAVVVAVAGHGTRPRDARPVGVGPSAAGTVTAGAAPATARDLFLVAAGQTEKTAAQTGRYRVQETETGDTAEVGPAAHPYEIMRKLLMQNWLPVRPAGPSVLYSRSLGAAPATPADEAAWRADGSPARWTQQGPEGLKDIVIEAAPESKMQGPRSGPEGASFVFSGAQLTAAQLAALPTDAAVLRRWLENRYRKVYEGGKAKEYDLFILGEQLVIDLPAPAKVRAAAYRMMADLDGAKSLGSVTDQRGRGGIAVGFFRRGDGGWVQRRLIIDPGSGESLADESWSYGAGAQPAKSGKLMSYTLVLDTRYTDDEPPA